MKRFFIACYIILFLVGGVYGYLRDNVKREYITKEDFLYLIEKKANKYSIPIEIAKALVEQESNYNPNAISKCQAIGLCQIMPSTFIAFSDKGMNPFDPEDNVEVGMRYLYTLYSKHPNWNNCLAIYNGGYRYNKSKQAQLYVCQVIEKSKKY